MALDTFDLKRVGEVLADVVRDVIPDEVKIECDGCNSKITHPVPSPGVVSGNLAEKLLRELEYAGYEVRRT